MKWILLAICVALLAYLIRGIRKRQLEEKSKEPHPNDVGTRFE